MTVTLNRQALRQARKKARLSPEELGARVGIGRSAIINLENGWQNTTPERLAAISHVLKIKDMRTLFIFGENNDNTAKPLDK